MRYMKIYHDLLMSAKISKTNLSVLIIFLHQYNLSSHNNKFSNTIFDGLNGIGISDVLMNLMTCHGFSKVKQYTVILIYRSTLLSYFLSKYFDC